METMAVGGAINNWTSSMIPPTIRRPWRVFKEDLEDMLEDLKDQLAFVLARLARVQARLEAVQGRGAQATFTSLPEELQRTYAEVSLKELLAYVCWRCAKRSEETPMQFEPAWHVLDCDDKARWVPEDHRAVLMADAIWAPLLFDGPTACDFASTLPADGARGDAKDTGASSRVGDRDCNGRLVYSLKPWRQRKGTWKL